jgi:acetyl-CoA carboxylase biotin carboxyl carrier protein
MDQPALTAGAAPPPPDSPGDGDATVLAAVCWAAGALLERAPAPVSSLRVRCGPVTVDMRWPSPPSPPAGTGGAPPAPPVAAPEEPAVAYVRAPMVGTFYHAPTPDTPPFVKVGDVVEAGQQVGIVEAMKLMNAVEAERSGRVVDVLVGNAAAVEFDQRLIAVAPLDPAGEPSLALDPAR